MDTSMKATLLCLLVVLPWQPAFGQDVTGQDRAPRDPSLRHITRRFWQWKVREYPEVATEEGFHDNDDKLENYAYSNMFRRMEFCRGILGELETINKTALNHDDTVTYEVLLDQLQTYVNGFEWRDYGALNPLNFLEGIHRSFGWVAFAKFQTLHDYEKYIRRLNSIPQQIEDIIQLLNRAVLYRRTNHQVSMRGVVEAISSISNVSVTQTPYYSPFGYTLDVLNETPEVRRNLRSQGVSIIEFHVQPSFRRLKQYVETRYIPFTRKEIGVGSMENGDAYYRNVLKWHLSANVTPEEVHRIGLAEVDRIKVEMEKLMRWLDFDGDLKSFFGHLRQNKEFFDHDETRLLEKYKRTVYQRIQPRLPQLFGNLSTIPNISVFAMQSDGLDAFYVKGAMFINTFKPELRPDFDALTLCLHEAVPGHHLQVSFARNQPLPDFRRYLGYNKISTAPFHFPIYTAYVEGWALYAEFLGEEMGLFDKPYELFGRYSLEIFRAGRMVVDTGIHVMGWSREKAIEFLSNSTFMTRTQIEKEVDRYITWPGQACAYKIGELKIRELRDRAITKLGWRYNPHDFHRHILETGPIPLNIMEKHINHWIGQNIPSVAHSRQMDNFNFAVVIFLSFYRTLLFHFGLL